MRNPKSETIVSHPEDDRPPMAVAMGWVGRLTTVGLEMSLPPLAGWWADGRLGTEPWLLIVGGVLGFVTGFTHLLHETLSAGKQAPKEHRPERLRGEDGDD